MHLHRCVAAFVTLAFLAPPLYAQSDDAPGTRNVKLVGHLPLGGLQPGPDGRPGRRTGDVELEQNLDRPYVYIARRFAPQGFDIIDLTHPARPRLLTSWQLPDEAPSTEAGTTDITYFMADGRTYVIQAFQFSEGSALAEVGAVVIDVTDLPNTDGLREVARLTSPMGFNSLFVYRHADGRTLLLASGGADLQVYDLNILIQSGPENAQVTTLETPPQLDPKAKGFDYAFAGFHPETQQDRLYGAGGGGYYVYDISDVKAPELLTSVSSAAVQRGQRIVPSPDGRYAVTSAAYRLSPLRIFDLQPGLDKSLKRIRTATGAWMADWRNYARQFEVRWPYVFVAARQDGLQIFNMRDATEPYTIGYYRTWTGPAPALKDRALDDTGAGDVDVRNADGLIVVTDFNTGLWTFSLEGFQGWEGRGWGLPNVSSVQDWENGPDGVY